MSNPKPSKNLHHAIGPSAGIASLGIAIAGLVRGLQADDNKKRGEFTQRMVTELHEKDPNYNYVITHHRGSKAEGPHVSHNHFELPMAVGTCGYEIFSSPKGQPFRFVLNGDGGYINWAFIGNFERNGKTLTAR